MKDATTIEVTVTHYGAKYTALVEPLCESYRCAQVAVFRHHDGIKEQSGTGTWGMDQIVDCTASCPPEVYDALDEAIIEELDR